MRPSKARSELSVGLACHMRWVTYEGAVHLRPARHTPEVGAGCGKAARPVLCGGRIAICVPTAIPRSWPICAHEATGGDPIFQPVGWVGKGARARARATAEGGRDRRIENETGR
jgi:hypothetical protein